MMDPGSWEVTIDGLIATIGTTSHGVTNFIRAVRAARADLVRLTRELSDLRLELELLRDEHNVPRQIQSRGVAVLDGCGVVLHRIGSLLGCGESSSSSSAVLQQDTAASPPRPPPRWSVKERFATSNLCNCLQTYREALTLLPDLASLRTSKDGPQPGSQSVDTAEVEEKSSSILEAVQDLREAIPQAEPAISDSRPALELYLNEVAHYTQAVVDHLMRSCTSDLLLVGKKPLDRMAPSLNQSMARELSDRSRHSTPQDPRGLAGSTGIDTSSPSPSLSLSPYPASAPAPAPNGPLETVGPWFPSENLPVPFYSSRHEDQALQHRANSFHVPRSPAPQLPLPRPPPLPQSPPPVPPPKGALPMLPPGAPRSKHAQRHIAELAGSNAPHVGHHYSSHHPSGHLEHHQDQSETSYTRQRTSNSTAHQIIKSPHDTVGRHRAASEHDVAQQPYPADAWVTSYYVPSTPPSTSGQSSQRTSFQPSSLDSGPSRDTNRSSASTGPLSNVDSMSPGTSPRVPPPATGDTTASVRPSSPRPSTTTTRSSGSAGKGGSSLRDKIPGVFGRSKRKSLQSSADSVAQTTAYRNSVSTGSSSTVDQTPIAQTSLSVYARRAERQIDIVPAEGLTDGTKGTAIHHMEISPTGSTIATQHANNTIKVWFITTGTVDGLIKYSSKVQPGPRSRMYFLRPHAIMSENSTLVAITTSYGNTIEFWNWTKKKRVQSIDHAARWACYAGDVFEANMRPLAVYRNDGDRIDLYTAVRDAKKPFQESRRINLKNAELPFIPKFPDLAYSSTGPLLVGAAGPRPGAPPDSQQTLLMAWQIDEQQGENPRPYRWVVPDHAEINGALPAALATYGSVAVSIWFPANYRHVVTSRGESKRVPVPTPYRHVLVWDLATNRTRFFPIPNALSCISPDCRFVAYCAPEQNRFVVVDVATGGEVWAGPDGFDVKLASGLGPAASQQLLGDLNQVTEFRFTSDSGLLYVADAEGGVGIYEVRQAGGGRNGSVSTASGGVAGPYGFAEMGKELSRTATGDERA